MSSGLLIFWPGLGKPAFVRILTYRQRVPNRDVAVYECRDSPAGAELDNLTPCFGAVQFDDVFAEGKPEMGQYHPGS